MQHVSLSAVLTLCCVLVLVPDLGAQGCVAVRGSSSCPLHPSSASSEGESGHLRAGDWQVSVGYRWLYSDRHFRGSHEEANRQEAGTEVVNLSHFIDFNALYAVTSRWSLGVTLPYVTSRRSSLYEHPGAGRNNSRAQGFGDLRVTGFGWVIDPAANPRGNLLLGVGLKAPTGRDDVSDTFETAAGPVRGTVDQSIQPGDGGWGFTTELFGFLSLGGGGSAYVQGFYLFNPQGDNGVSTISGRPRSNPYEQVMSIPDQYMLRAGLSYLLWPEQALTVSLGGRIEGVPVYDVFGDSQGFRRPGYAISAEPGIRWERGPWTFELSAPIALYRNRQQSVPDKSWTRDSGVYRHGDAAFADVVVTVSIARKL